MLGDIKAKQGSGLKVDKVIVMTDRLNVEPAPASLTHVNIETGSEPQEDWQCGHVFNKQSQQ